MAKNTSKKSSKQKNSFINDLKNAKWYLKAILIVALVTLGFFIFKYSVNAYNISLLDKAEAKMRAMDLPKADSTEYKRSCSFRSVKFGSAGSPNCRVVRTDTFNTTAPEIGAGIAKTYIESYPKLKTNYVDNDEFIKRLSMTGDSTPRADINRFQDGLNCYVKANLDFKDNNVTGALLTMTTSCYRKFMFQTYPENI